VVLGINILFVFVFVFEEESHYVAQANLEFTQAALQLPILLPQLPECWDYRCKPPHPASMYFFFNNKYLLIIVSV
jgi:hypothetical protein